MKIINAVPGLGTPLTENEIKDFLANSRLNMHISTLDDKGDSIIHPTWYYFDPASVKFYIETFKNSIKVANLSRNNHVYFCVDDPNPPHKGVKGKGRVRVQEDVNHNVPIAEKIMVRYLGSLTHPMASLLIDNVKDGSSVILEITPSYFSTWDMTKSKWI